MGKQIMTSGIQALAMAALLATALVGCSAKVSSDGGAPVVPTGGNDFADKVQGPAIEGHWISVGCTKDDFGDGSMKFDLTLANHAVTKIKTTYSDAACATQKEQVTNTGVYRFDEKLLNDIYSVEYRMDFPNMPGATFKAVSNIKRADSSLFITDNSSGEGFLPDIELKLAGASDPGPGPGPGPGVGAITPFIGQWSTACTVSPDSSTAGTRTVVTVQSGLVIRDDVTYSDYPKCMRGSAHNAVKVQDYVLGSGGMLLIHDLTMTLVDANNASSTVGAMTLISHPTTVASYAPVYAGSCPNFAGAWQMNDFYFTVLQDHCTAISVTGAGVPDDVSTFYDYDFFPDGQQWTRTLRGYVSSTSHFTEDALVHDYDRVDASGALVQLEDKFYLTYQPCDLSNPSGEQYLVKQTWDRATQEEQSCDFFSRW